MLLIVNGCLSFRVGGLILSRLACIIHNWHCTLFLVILNCTLRTVARSWYIVTMLLAVNGWLSNLVGDLVLSHILCITDNLGYDISCLTSNRTRSNISTWYGHRPLFTFWILSLSYFLAANKLSKAWQIIIFKISYSLKLFSGFNNNNNVNEIV